MLLQGAELVLVHLRLLKVQLLGSLGHQGLVVPQHFPAPAAQDMDNLVNVPLVLIPRDFSHTRGLALADMELQAGAEFAPEDGVGGNFEVTGAEGIDFVKEVHHVPRVHHAAVRAKVAVPLAFLDAAGDEHPGEIVTGNANPGVGFGILEEDVVLGLVLLDEVVLQQEGIGLGIYHRELGIGNFAHQDARLGVQALRGNKILRHPLVEVLGLAHINNLSLGVIVSIHAGGMGK